MAERPGMNDTWVGQTPLRQQFLDIYNLNQQKLATTSEVKNGHGICPSEDSSSVHGK